MHDLVDSIGSQPIGGVSPDSRVSVLKPSKLSGIVIKPKLKAPELGNTESAWIPGWHLLTFGVVAVVVLSRKFPGKTETIVKLVVSCGGRCTLVSDDKRPLGRLSRFLLHTLMLTARLLWSALIRAIAWVLFRWRAWRKAPVGKVKGTPSSSFLDSANPSAAHRKTSGMQAHEEEEEEEVEMQELGSIPAAVPKIINCPVDSILTEDMMKQLSQALPLVVRFKEASLVYSLHKHGASLDTFYHMMELSAYAMHKGPPFSTSRFPNILLVKDTLGYVFGLFSDHYWKQQAPGTEFYGDGQTFLFTIYPNLQFYRWSGDNSFFMHAAADAIGVGGGSNFALHLDQTFLHGSSGDCETFGSPSLASSTEFKCSALEAWCFIDPFVEQI